MRPDLGRSKPEPVPITTNALLPCFNPYDNPLRTMLLLPHIWEHANFACKRRLLRSPLSTLKNDIAIDKQY